MSRIDVVKFSGDIQLSQVFFDDGVQVDPDPVTVTVTRTDGTVLAADDAAVKSGVGETAVFKSTLAAGWLERVDVLSVAWVRDDTGGTVTDQVEVVGAQLFTLDDMRAFDDGEYADPVKFPNAAIATARTEVTDYLEQETNQSWVPRFAERHISGTGLSTLQVPDFHVTEILAVWIDTIALTSAEVAAIVIDGRILYLPSGYWAEGVRNVRIHYEYGRVAPKFGVSRIAKILAADRLQPANVQYHAESMSDDGTTVNYADGPTEPARWITKHLWRSRSGSVSL